MTKKRELHERPDIKMFVQGDGERAGNNLIINNLIINNLIINNLIINNLKFRFVLTPTGRWRERTRKPRPRLPSTSGNTRLKSPQLQVSRESIMYDKHYALGWSGFLFLI